MCMFCAAIPMSVALGSAATAKHKEKRRQALATGKIVRVSPLPIGKLSMALTGGLIVGSAVYHLIIMPRTGMIM
jgi:hypothetical protein